MRKKLYGSKRETQISKSKKQKDLDDEESFERSFTLVCSVILIIVVVTVFYYVNKFFTSIFSWG